MHLFNGVAHCFPPPSQPPIQFDIGLGHLDKVVVLADILIALAAERGDEREVVDKLCEFFHTTLVGGEDVDNRVEDGLVEDSIVLWFAATDTDNTVGHGL